MTLRLPSISPSRTIRLATISLLAFASSGAAFGQLVSNTPTVTLTATLGEILTLSLSTNTVNFALVQGGTAAGSNTFTVTTTWLLLPSRANLVLDGYFASATAALSDTATTPDKIPTSAVFASTPNGTPTSPTAFTSTAALGPAGAGLTFFTLPLTSANRAGTRSDIVSMQINLSTLPQLPAGTYTGTLTLQAQAL